MKKAILWAVGGMLGLFLVMAAGIALIGLQLADFGQKTVVQTIPSPDGTYEARVIDDDQGALGGSTIVEVDQNGWAKPKQIYTGPWGIFETMEIYWKDEDTLVINGKEYRVD